MIPVVELLRVSTEGQAGEDRAGLPAQRQTNARTTASYQLTIVETVEIVESGADVARSPQMTALLELVTSGRARGIVLAEYSRLFRPDRWSDLFVLQTLSDHDARIYLPSGPIDLQTELGFVQATVNNLLAAMERRRIRERMMRGKEEHRRRGEHMGGGIGLPLGLTWSKQGGWEYTSEIDRVRAIFRLFLGANHNCQAIGDLLGISRTTVNYILRNPVYSGWKVWDQRRDTRRPDRKVMRAAEDVIRVRLPLAPVVTEQEFELVQRIIANKPRVAYKSKAHLYLYRGFVACACGEPLYGMLGGYKSRSPYYLCKSRMAARRVTAPCGAPYVQAKYLEPALDRSITDQLLDPDVLVAAVDAYNGQASEWREPPKPPVKQHQGKRARIIELYVEGVIDKSERDRRLSALDAVIPLPTKPERLSADDVIAFVSTLAEWAVLTRPAKRELLEAFAPRFITKGLEVQGVHLPLLQSQTSSDGWRRNDSLWVPLAVA